ncbi:G1/S-specific cyclin-D2-like [Protopterus annectens]|uniref:G1/S-specific cyclin-D2-like n=1 Tax=Protopterus annectens TaxID=7888 RepID=UPI001CFBFE94|nr:G1/S-specific cyclin-D2-like [Protopterus annectens]
MDMERALLCCEVSDERKAMKDPALLGGRVLLNLLEVEERYLPSASYFQRVQKHLQPHMRKTLVNWMLEVCEEHSSEAEVFPLAVNYLDRYLSVISTDKTQLQLLGAACLLLASKFKETKPMSIEELCTYSDYSICEQELKAMELLVLNKLKWDIAAVTPSEFLPHILEWLPLPEEKVHLVHRHTDTFIALCTTDYSFIAFPPSIIAAASLAAAVTGLQLKQCEGPFHNLGFTDCLAHLVRCDSDFLKACQEQIEFLLKSIVRQSQRDQSPETKSVDEPERSSTPTDLQDIDL